MNFIEHKNNNIYIIEVFNSIGESLIKVGYSNNIIKRLTTYYYHNPFIKVIESCFLLDGLSWEKDFHKNNKSLIMNEWYNKEFLPIILDNLKDLKADFNKYIPNVEEFNKESFINNNIKILPWVLENLNKLEYTFKELEFIFLPLFKEKGLIFNGYTIKDYFPEFEKSRKIKNKIRDTYYKFKI